MDMWNIYYESFLFLQSDIEDTPNLDFLDIESENEPKEQVG